MKSILKTVNKKTKCDMIGGSGYNWFKAIIVLKNLMPFIVASF